jgi:hypothetical protein
LASLNERLGKLEAALPLERGEPYEAQRKREWLAGASVRRHRDQNHDEWRARDLIRLLRYQGRLPPDADGLRARLLAWTPALDPRAVERATAQAIYDREAGLEGMECDPAWFEAFEARAELVKLHAAVPVEVLARWSVEGATDGHEDCDDEVELYGLSDALYLRAVGPDAGELAHDELMRRLRQILDEDTYGTRAYLVAQHIQKLQTKETM